MIRSLFLTSDPQILRGIDRVANLMESDEFLSALGPSTLNAREPMGFHVVRDVEYASRMMTSQEIWDMPEPWPYQYFPGVLEDELGRLAYSNGLSDLERRLVERSLDAAEQQFYDISSRLIVSRFHTMRLDRLSEIFLYLDEMKFIIEDILPSQIQAYLYYIVSSILYCRDIEDSRLFRKMLEAFETGGMPCGWVGRLPEDGGDPETSIQLLHFGQS